MKTRPYLRAQLYTWRASDGTETPGVALKHGGQIKAHLTPEEALRMADKLVDLSEQTTKTEQVSK